MNEDKSRLPGELSYDLFRKRAQNIAYSNYEKIGFADELRIDKEVQIFQDVIRKLSNLTRMNQRVLDIGAGCTSLPHNIAAHCEKQETDLYLIDSMEMLSNLEINSTRVTKIPGMFPNHFADFINENKGTFDVILAYSVLQYVAIDTSLVRFIDSVAELLKEGGQCLLGDIPNIDKRNRFFSSAAGVNFHRSRNGVDTFPDVQWNRIHSAELDDSLIFFVLQRFRNFGFESYLLPQDNDLPMSNRREDILIIKH